MVSLRIVFVALALGVTYNLTALAQAGSRHLDTKARVLDHLFPLDVTPQPYHLKVVLRFGDSDSQLIVVIYPGGNAEAIVYTLAEMKSGDLDRFIKKLETETPGVTATQIASRVKVTIERSPLDGENVDRLLKRLSAIRISPALPTIVCVDSCPKYEFWYDTWQDVAHFSLVDPSKGPTHDLVQWMIKFRDDLPGLIRPPSAAAR